MPRMEVRRDVPNPIADGCHQGPENANSKNWRPQPLQPQEDLKSKQIRDPNDNSIRIGLSFRQHHAIRVEPPTTPRRGPLEVCIPITTRSGAPWNISRVVFRKEDHVLLLISDQRTICNFLTTKRLYELLLGTQAQQATTLTKPLIFDEILTGISISPQHPSTNGAISCSMCMLSDQRSNSRRN